MAVGIVYNAGRIALAERSRELATLRVLGFSRGEVSGLFLGEQLLLVALSLAPGWALGWGLTWFIITSVSSGDLFRLTVVTPASSYVFATLVVLGAALATALLLRRRLDRLDLVAVLKARE
jgi:putative ABC transport system permease protein